MTYCRVNDLLKVLLTLYFLIKYTECDVLEIDNSGLLLVIADLLFDYCEDLFICILVDVFSTTRVISYLISILKIKINSFKFKNTAVF